MSITVGSISAAQLAAYSAGKPSLLARNALANYAGQNAVDVTNGIGPETGVSAVWRTCLGTYMSPTPINTVSYTDNGQNPLRAFDYSLSAFTGSWRGYGTTSAVWGGGMALTCVVDPTVPIDTIIIANHNFKEIAEVTGGDVMVDVWFDDTNTFANALVDKNAAVLWRPTTPHPTGFSAFTKERLVCFDLGADRLVDGVEAGFLGHNYQYTGVSYAQIRVMIAAGTSSVSMPAPQIGEIFMGPRRQLSRFPGFTTWNNDEIESVVGEFTSKGGVKTRYGLSMGQSVYSPNWTTGGAEDEGTEDLHGLNDLKTLEDFWADCKYGGRPFFFIPDPLNARNVAPFCRVVDADFPATLVGGLTEREVSFDFEELSPYVRGET